MTSKREREYARRRYEKYRERQQARASRAARRRRFAAIAGAAGAVAAVIAVVLLVVVDPGSSSGASDTPTAAADGSVDTAQAAAATADPADCPGVAPGPVAEPSQTTTVPAPDGNAYTVTFSTSCGDVVARLDGAAAPQAVGNLVTLARGGFYDETPCHRLTTSGIYVLQCGDPTGTGQGGPGYAFGPVENAPADDTYPAGTIAMARQGDDGSSMGSQFFVVYNDSTIPSDSAGGYTVMGTVTSGLDIVQRIADAGTGADGVAPAQPIGITSVTVQEAQ